MDAWPIYKNMQLGLKLCDLLISCARNFLMLDAKKKDKVVVSMHSSEFCS